jgi:hypothetical protein
MKPIIVRPPLLQFIGSKPILLSHRQQGEDPQTDTLIEKTDFAHSSSACLDKTTSLSGSPTSLRRYNPNLDIICTDSFRAAAGNYSHRQFVP